MIRNAKRRASVAACQGMSPPLVGGDCLTLLPIDAFKVLTFGVLGFGVLVLKVFQILLNPRNVYISCKFSCMGFAREPSAGFAGEPS